MRPSFAFNVAFLIFVNLLVKPFWVFGIDRTVQNNVGEAAYRAYFAVFNFTYIFQINSPLLGGTSVQTPPRPCS